MAARKRKIRGCKVGGKDCGQFLRYLTGTIIPDTLESGRTATAADLQAGVKFLQGADRVRIGRVSYTRQGFIDYLEGTLIPDFEDSGSEGYAEDFSTIVYHLKQRRS